MEILMGCLVLIVIESIVGIVNTQKANKIKAAEALLKNCKLDGKVLYIDQQNKVFLTVLTTKAHVVSEYKRDPLKIHVGAATVGGVTTGGVYTTGGGISQTDLKDGKVELIYKQIDKPKANEVHPTTFISENEVHEIVLSTELAEKAKKSEIKEYLHGNTIMVVEKINPSAYCAQLMKSGQRLAAAS